MKEALSLLFITVLVLTISVFSFNSVANNIQVSSMPAPKTEVKNETANKKKDKKEEKKTVKAEKSIPAEEENSAIQSEAEQPAQEQAEQTAEPQVETPVSTPAPVQNTAPAPVVQPVQNYSAPSGAEARLNSASLYSQYTSCGELNNAINNILNSCTNSSMSTYEKAKACYNFILNNCREGYIYGSYSYKTGGWNVNAQALALFTEYRGMCDCYSAGLTVLFRAIGLNASQVEGNIPYYTDHDWCEVNISGVRYIFDVDVEADAGYQGREHYFCKTYGELGEYTYLRTIG